MNGMMNNKEPNMEEVDAIQYVKGELIGSGAYGKVYSALDMITGQLLAVKTIEVSVMFNCILVAIE